MVRWQPGTLERLQLAALELFEERGYDQTTVADIAALAGLTERTFYRYFTDKREVLMSGSAELSGLLASTIAAQPADAAPLTVVSAALRALGPFFDSRRSFSVRRQAVIATSGNLQERELAKLDALTATVTGALVDRGIPDATATLVATVGISVFHLGFRTWVSDAGARPFVFFVDNALVDLHAEVSASWGE